MRLIPLLILLAFFAKAQQNYNIPLTLTNNTSVTVGIHEINYIYPAVGKSIIYRTSGAMNIEVKESLDSIVTLSKCLLFKVRDTNPYQYAVVNKNKIERIERTSTGKALIKLYPNYSKNITTEETFDSVRTLVTACQLFVTFEYLDSVIQAIPPPSDTSGYNTSFTHSNDSLYLTDDASTLAVFLNTTVKARTSISETITGIDYNNSTGVFSNTSGYSIPTTASQSNWDTAFNNRVDGRGNGIVNQWAYWSDANTITTSNQLTRTSTGLQIGGSNYLGLGSWTTLTRHPSPSAGWLGLNSTTSYPEYYNQSLAAWDEIFTPWDRDGSYISTTYARIGVGISPAANVHVLDATASSIRAQRASDNDYVELRSDGIRFFNAGIAQSDITYSATQDLTFTNFRDFYFNGNLYVPSTSSAPKIVSIHNTNSPWNGVRIEYATVSGHSFGEVQAWQYGIGYNMNLVLQRRGGKIRVGGATTPTETLDITGSLGVSDRTGVATNIGGWTSANKATNISTGFGINLTAGGVLEGDSTKLATQHDVAQAEQNARDSFYLSDGTLIVNGDTIPIGTSVGRILYVSKEDGNNATAQVGNIFKPWKEPWTAAAAADTADLIVVMPGTYTYGTSSADFNGTINLWLHAKINYYFHPGARITYDTTGGFTGGSDILFTTGNNSGLDTRYLNVLGQGSFLLGSASLFNTTIDNLDYLIDDANIVFNADTISTIRIQERRDLKLFKLNANYVEQHSTGTFFLYLLGSNLSFGFTDAIVDVNIKKFRAPSVSYTSTFSWARLQYCNYCNIRVHITDMKIVGKNDGILLTQQLGELNYGTLRFEIDNLTVTDPYIGVNYNNYYNVTTIGNSSTDSTQVGALFKPQGDGTQRGQTYEFIINNYRGHASILGGSTNTAATDRDAKTISVKNATMLNGAPFYKEPLTGGSADKGIFVIKGDNVIGDSVLIITGGNPNNYGAPTDVYFQGIFQSNGASVIRQNLRSNRNHLFQSANLIVGNTANPISVATSTDQIRNIQYFDTRTNSRALDIDATPSYEYGTAVARDTAITGLEQKTSLTGDELIQLLNEGTGRYVTAGDIANLGNNGLFSSANSGASFPASMTAKINTDFSINYSNNSLGLYFDDNGSISINDKLGNQNINVSNSGVGITVGSNTASATFNENRSSGNQKGFEYNIIPADMTDKTMVPKVYVDQSRKTFFTPTTGSTITAIKSQVNIVNPSGTIATLTINTPGSPADGDTFEVVFKETVTAITWGVGTVVKPVTTAVNGTHIKLIYNSGDSSWY